MVDKPKQRLIIPPHLLYPFAGFNLRNLDCYSGFQNIQPLPNLQVRILNNIPNSSV